MGQWWTAVVIVLCLTLPGGCCKETDILTEYQPTGPKMCQMKCQLNKKCVDFGFDQQTLKCVLYKKSRTGNGENTNGLDKSSPGDTKKILKQIRPVLMNVPPKLQKLAEECEVAGSKDSSECLADRRDQLRCVKSVQPVSSSDDEMFDCGPCTARGKVAENYKYHWCTCSLGCSKQIRGRQATCLRKCETYGTSFKLTEGLSIRGHNKLKFGASFERCKERCINEKTFTCLSFEYRVVDVYKICSIQNVSWFDVTKEDRIEGNPKIEFFHRNCN